MQKFAQTDSSSLSTMKNMKPCSFFKKIIISASFFLSSALIFVQFIVVFIKIETICHYLAFIFQGLICWSLGEVPSYTKQVAVKCLGRWERMVM